MSCACNTVHTVECELIWSNPWFFWKPYDNLNQKLFPPFSWPCAQYLTLERIFNAFCHAQYYFTNLWRRLVQLVNDQHVCQFTNCYMYSNFFSCIVPDMYMYFYWSLSILNLLRDFLVKSVLLYLFFLSDSDEDPLPPKIRYFDSHTCIECVHVTSSNSQIQN